MKQAQFLKKVQKLINHSDAAFTLSQELSQKLDDMGFDNFYITWDVADGILIAHEGEQFVLTGDAFDAIFENKTSDELLEKLKNQTGRTL